ncbi:hypothetical protein BDZ88DRAFT_259721 [Geranomyces variabilis]|nr:hypothetical protein BDZ88DRAFT_259721 [Geranomyces variabilis]
MGAFLARRFSGVWLATVSFATYSVRASVSPPHPAEPPDVFGLNPAPPQGSCVDRQVDRAVTRVGPLSGQVNGHGSISCQEIFRRLAGHSELRHLLGSSIRQSSPIRLMRGECARSRLKHCLNHGCPLSEIPVPLTCFRVSSCGDAEGSRECLKRILVVC